MAEFDFQDPGFQDQQAAFKGAFEENAGVHAYLQDHGFTDEARLLAIRAFVELSDRAYTLARYTWFAGHR
jgi:hypothetical protein